MQAADIDAVDVTITEMTNIVTVFDIVGDGTTALLENIVISNNDIAQTNPNNLWTGINIRDNAMGSVSNSSFVKNTNMRHVFSASRSASLDVLRSMVVGASGGRVVVRQFEKLNIYGDCGFLLFFILVFSHHNFFMHITE